jgi:hypothetical protein
MINSVLLILRVPEPGDSEGARTELRQKTS